MSAPVTAGYLATVVVAFFDLTAQLAADDPDPLAEMDTVAFVASDDGIDVAIAQHPQSCVDRDPDRLIQAVAVTVDLATSVPALQYALVDMESRQVSRLRALLIRRSVAGDGQIH